MRQKRMLRKHTRRGFDLRYVSYPRSPLFHAILERNLHFLYFYQFFQVVRLYGMMRYDCPPVYIINTSDSMLSVFLSTLEKNPIFDICDKFISVYRRTQICEILWAQVKIEKMMPIRLRELVGLFLWGQVRILLITRNKIYPIIITYSAYCYEMKPDQSR